MKTRTITGHHRSARLAERHRRALEKKYRVPVEIVARRNAKGRFSRTGRQFNFRLAIVPKKRKGEALQEFLVVWKYESKKNGSRTLDFSVVAGSRERALQLAFEGVEDGMDKKGNSIAWAEKIPWDETEVIKVAGKRRFRKESVKVR